MFELKLKFRALYLEKNYLRVAGTATHYLQYFISIVFREKQERRNFRIGSGVCFIILSLHFCDFRALHTVPVTMKFSFFTKKSCKMKIRWRLNFKSCEVSFSLYTTLDSRTQSCELIIILCNGLNSRWWSMKMQHMKTIELMECLILNFVIDLHAGAAYWILAALHICSIQCCCCIQ